MKLIYRHNFRDINFSGLMYYVTEFYKAFYKKLQEKYPDIEFVHEADKKYESFGDGGLYSCLSASILNPETKKYILFSHHDAWKYHFFHHMDWEPHNMVKFYYAGSFNFVDYFNYKKTNSHNPDISLPSNIKDLYRPMYYNGYFEIGREKLDLIYKSRKEKELKSVLNFRGWMWDHRKLMSDILPKESFEIIDKNENNQNLNFVEYLEDMSSYKACLSFPGGTNICNRDFEAFSIGVPVIRPYIDKVFDDPLIPDYHYISFYQNPRYWQWHLEYLNYKDFQDNLIDIWEKVKDNDELLEFISENCYNWYIKNCTMDKIIDGLLKEVDLTLLN